MSDIRISKEAIKEFYSLVENGIYEITEYDIGMATFSNIEMLITNTNGEDIDEIDDNIYGVCSCLDLITHTLINEIKRRGNQPKEYEKLKKHVIDIIDLVARKINFKQDYLPTKEEFISVKEVLKTVFKINFDKMEEDRVLLLVNLTANGNYRQSHPLYYVYQPLLEILDRVEYEQSRSLYNNSCIAAFFDEKEMTSSIDEKDTINSDVLYFPLTTYMGATSSSIRRVLTSRRPFGGVKIPWKNKKGDAYLLCEVLGFTISQVDSCFSFTGGKAFTSSCKTKSENKDLQQILTTIKMFMGKNLPKNLLQNL